MHQQNLHPLTLYQTLHVRQYAKDHVFDGALLLKDHACQIEQHLITLDFQLRFLKQLRITQSDATELQVRGEDLQRRKRLRIIFTLSCNSLLLLLLALVSCQAAYVANKNP